MLCCSKILLQIYTLSNERVAVIFHRQYSKRKIYTEIQKIYTLFLLPMGKVLMFEKILIPLLVFSGLLLVLARELDDQLWNRTNLTVHRITKCTNEKKLSLDLTQNFLPNFPILS